MNRSYSKIRHIRESNSLLESKTVLSEQDGNATSPNQVAKPGNPQTQETKTIINKVATEGIKNVTPQMISSPQFKGSYSGYQFGGTFNNVNYQWDCNGVEGMSGIRGMVDGEILTETVENMSAAIKKPVTDAKPGSLCVGFYAPASKFIIYTNTSNKPMCLNF
jgi:hypothetical protein